MEPVIKKIEIIVSCKEQVCAQIAKLKDDIAKTEEEIISLEKAYNAAKQEDEKKAKNPDREECILCGGTGIRMVSGWLFTHETPCWVCDGKETVLRFPLFHPEIALYWQDRLFGQKARLLEMQQDLKYLEDQIQNG